MAEDGEDEDWSNLDKTDKLKVIGDCDGKMAYVSASNRSTPDYQLHSIMFYWDDEQAINGASSMFRALIRYLVFTVLLIMHRMIRMHQIWIMSRLIFQ